VVARGIARERVILLCAYYFSSHSLPPLSRFTITSYPAVPLFLFLLSADEKKNQGTAG